MSSRLLSIATVVSQMTSGAALALVSAKSADGSQQQGMTRTVRVKVS